MYNRSYSSGPPSCENSFKKIRTRPRGQAAPINQFPRLVSFRLSGLQVVSSPSIKIYSIVLRINSTCF